MYIKIYFDSKPLFLCDALDDTLQPYIHQDDCVFIDELNTHTVKTMLHELQQQKVHAGVFLHPALDDLRNAFFKKFTVLKAAGGLVKNENNEVLFIFRRGKWDFPKGHIDKGEKPEKCALREVKEETGLKKVKLISQLITTYHTYHEGTRFILKESKWFLMEADGKQLLTPQAEEEITDIKWVKSSGIKEYLEQSFASVRDVSEAWLSE
ncbi:MAG: NUDIX domain-containing protein [Chitinophagaceae bacterium]|nr:NUDIX domain-containing protein [Chitinophagaceae bacterium]